MFETAGALAIIQPVLTLVGLVALPLLWTVVAAFFTSRRDGLLGTIVAITCAVGTLGLSIVLAVQLAHMSKGHVLVQHVAQLARLGQLDLAFDLALDPRSATYAVVIGIIACASALQTSWSSGSTSGRLAWTGLATSGAMLTCIGDGFAPILVGLGLLSLAAWGLNRGDHPSPTIASIAGNVSVLLGFIFLFWSLGGVFSSEGYDADGAPRFVLVTTRAEGPPDRSTLVMTTHAGALVSADDTDLPGEPLTAPFSIAVPPGLCTLRVQGGTASGDVRVPRVALLPGRTQVLAPYGPTASLRVLDDQLAVPRPSATGAPLSVRATLSSRTIAGLRASAIVLILVLGGVLAHLHALASRRGPSAIACVLEALPAPWLALRFAGLVEPSGADGALVVLLGAGSAVVLSARASCVDDGHKALRGVLAGTASVAVAATGLGEPSATLILSCAGLIASCAALAAIEARRDPRWLGVACASAVGLLPFAGASSGYILAVAAALGSAASGTIGWAAFTGTVAAALVIACTLGALAAFRVYDAIIHTAMRDPGRSRGQGAVVIAMTAIALVGGTALGAGTTMFGGNVVPLARRLSGPVPTPGVPHAMASIAVLLTLVAAAGGVILARRAAAASSPPEWLLVLGRPYAALAWAASGARAVTAFLQQSVVAMDRDIVEDIPKAVSELAGLGRAEAEPKPVGEWVRTVAVIVMVALLGLVVLSSLLLG
jgi:hypothetical protein